ncbi:Endonuclease, Uma2 family (restriction endonuclease fold) [Caldanaerobius fijiensis DSM 17918]|uniref:Endonuclease, Uma2 family (Restriction endonuclease fold) n=1 Tax=Caldanaerobius fijiensis DSM 17918 TaxID=1121256 RepID=A0A1M5D640_9THEO|nr:Uma2 family endonuclease [Caldanaerobius fijiensis]SHF62335.1 Endonuclease, Uma2 family (restriction endonuclease fold) [Caldanaerobius fijiensis DSM 17918]
MPLPKENKTYTYGDYITWPEDKRIELIDGQAYMMAPPSRIHQKVLGGIFYQFFSYLQNKSCEVYTAPFGVRLPSSNEENDKDIKTVVEPDIVVICDKSKLDDEGCKGAPDLIVEIVSPSTARKDKLEKFNLYEKFGVKEYWLVEPESKIVSVFTLQDNKRYGRPEIYTDEDKIKVSIFNDLIIDLKAVFQE